MFTVKFRRSVVSGKIGSLGNCAYEIIWKQISHIKVFENTATISKLEEWNYAKGAGGVV